MGSDAVVEAAGVSFFCPHPASKKTRAKLAISNFFIIPHMILKTKEQTRPGVTPSLDVL